MNILIQTVEFLIILFLLYYIFKGDRDKSIKKLKEQYFVLDKLKSMPKYSDVDPKYQLVIDLFDSAELEQWSNPKIDIDRYGTNHIEFEIENAEKKITITSQLYVKDDNVSISRLSFGQSYKKVYIDDKVFENIQVKTKVLTYIWKHILKDNDDNYTKEFNRIKNIKTNIEKQLVAINRNKTLEEILNG